ncbi:MAG: hemerythrin domain-containing protein [Candidatus Wallbacteria bacterium]|nr:hemerythrin domain-containing protein [Candidatus Wallbacteria bacterium]
MSSRGAVGIPEETAEDAASLSGWLSRDHSRHLDLLAKATAAREAKSFEEAGALFEEFARGLLHHMEAEETVLFPAFRAVTGSDSGTTASLDEEHVRLRQALEQWAEAIRAGDGASCAIAEAEFVTQLRKHVLREETFFYRMADDLLNDDHEAADLVRRMASFQSGGP